MTHIKSSYMICFFSDSFSVLIGTCSLSCRFCLVHFTSLLSLVLEVFFFFFSQIFLWLLCYFILSVCLSVWYFFEVSVSFTQFHSFLFILSHSIIKLIQSNWKLMLSLFFPLLFMVLRSLHLLTQYSVLRYALSARVYAVFFFFFYLCHPSGVCSVSVSLYLYYIFLLFVCFYLPVCIWVQKQESADGWILVYMEIKLN